MSTLVVRYATPVAAYPAAGRYTTRPTHPDPTLAGIQGILAAAAGIHRGAALPSWITDVNLTIRIERTGRLLRDFHTVNPPNLRPYRDLSDKDRAKIRTVALADGGRRTDPVITERWYVTDAAHTLLIADDDGRAEQALASPIWAYYAGRKSCPLTEPVILGRTDDSPARALSAVPSPRQPDDEPDDSHAVRRAIVFAEHPDADRHEDRNDRLVATGQHTTARRWHVTVRAPIVDDPFAVADHLAEAHA